MKAITTFIKSNKIAVYILLIGIVFGGGSLWLQSKEEWTIPAYLTVMKLLGVIALSLAVVMISSKQKKSILANIGMILFLLFSFELICFFMLGMPNKEKKDFSLPPVSEDHISAHLGTVPYADSVYRNLKTEGTDTVFDVHYTIDGNCMRTTPGHDSTKQTFAAFYGCSIAFGFGLDDDETFPYYFQQNSPYNSYNFAYDGYGTNHMLARLQYQNINEVVNENDGIGVYLFFWDHIERAIGSMDRYVKWVSNAPFYYMKDGDLVRDRSFKDGRYVTSKIYEKLYQSSIINYFSVGFPLSLNENHFDLVTEMVLKSKQVFKEQTGSEEFYLVIYPSYSKVEKESMNTFLQLLEKKGVEYIDLTKNYIYNAKSTLGGDPHPNAKTNEILSKRLIEEIKKKKK